MFPFSANGLLPPILAKDQAAAALLAVTGKASCFLFNMDSPEKLRAFPHLAFGAYVNPLELNHLDPRPRLQL